MRVLIEYVRFYVDTNYYTLIIGDGEEKYTLKSKRDLKHGQQPYSYIHKKLLDMQSAGLVITDYCDSLEPHDQKLYLQKHGWYDQPTGQHPRMIKVINGLPYIVNGTPNMAVVSEFKTKNGSLYGTYPTGLMCVRSDNFVINGDYSVVNGDLYRINDDFTTDCVTWNHGIEQVLEDLPEIQTKRFKYPDFNELEKTTDVECVATMFNLKKPITITVGVEDGQYVASEVEYANKSGYGSTVSDAVCDLIDTQIAAAVDGYLGYPENMLSTDGLAYKTKLGEAYAIDTSTPPHFSTITIDYVRRVNGYKYYTVIVGNELYTIKTKSKVKTGRQPYRVLHRLITSSLVPESIVITDYIKSENIGNDPILEDLTHGWYDGTVKNSPVIKMINGLPYIFNGTRNYITDKITTENGVLYDTYMDGILAADDCDFTIGDDYYIKSGRLYIIDDSCNASRVYTSSRDELFEIEGVKIEKFTYPFTIWSKQ